MNIGKVLDDIWAYSVETLDQTLSLRRNIAWKPDGSPVTDADFLHERWIGEMLRARIPGITMVAEESYQAGMALDSQWVAIVDPIDGTENFCSGLREWGIALSIWHEGKHAGSALMMPELNACMRSGQPVEKFQSRIVGCSSSYNEQIGKVISENTESRIMGCAVYNQYNVIRGSYSRFVNPKGAYCWDLQAGVSLALENNCTVFLEGEPYDGKLLAPDRRHRIDIRK